MKSINRRTFIRRVGLSAAALAVGDKFSVLQAFPEQNRPYLATVEELEQVNELCVVYPTDHGEALINPDMGWTMHFYSNLLENYGSRLEPADTLDYFPGLSTVYLRIPWAFVEPEEGKFCWETLDTPAQRWIDKGKKISIRITATESWMYKATPEWVFDAGAKGYDVDGTIYEPDYDDPVFLEKVENFVRAMGERYDGNPNVAFIDIGHYGMWGEGHTVLTTPKHGKSWGVEVQKKYIDLYLRHFKQTLLCISDDYAGHDLPGERFPIMDYAFSRGVSMRDDSILVQKIPRHWYHSEMAQLFWPSLPVILEHEHYGGSKKKGAWDKDLLLKSVEDYHAAYMSIHWWPDIFLEENKDIIRKINLRMGYRIQLQSLKYPLVVHLGEVFFIQSQWYNSGVTPCYRGGYPCFTLKDAKGGVVSVLVDKSFNVKFLSVAERTKIAFSTLNSGFRVAPRFQDKINCFSRTCTPGEYSLYVSVGQEDGTPVFELPYSESDGKKRYKMGKIILADYLKDE
ncbi:MULTISPECIES: beta-galactosidase [Bacteroides]|uniref:DUF4832 domain-containing protein n=1 Tax=Bacteroides nordii TaxID=291645 RepID=A0A413VSE6_9BACE|nr:MULTISPECIES: beta-galactosidase [Bacteroides]RHB36394.1 DUF4832 domain-containing protein [Bacteroides nordii]